MGTTYTMSGGINISPHLIYPEVKTAIKTALALVRPQDKKYATETNVFKQYMPLDLMIDAFDMDTEDGVLTVTRGIGLETMTNAAAARTFNVLASEGRRVVAGFVLGA